MVGCEAQEPPAAEPGTSPSPSPSTSASSGPTPAASLTVPDFDASDWASVREQFPLDPSVSQFAAFVLSPHTTQVQAAIDFHRARLSFDTETALFEGYGLELEVRRAAARYLGGRPAQVALTDSTTMGIATMYGGLSLGPGDEVITTTHDFYSTHDSLRLLEKRSGASVRQVALYDDPAAATVDQLTSRLVDAIRPQTRVVAVTWVHSGTGVRLPIKEMAAAIADLSADRGRRILVCVDGVHGFGAVDTDVADLGCDFLATGTHKWLFGPRGTGVLWGRDWEPLTELIPTFSGPAQDGGRLSPGGYHDFEHRWALTEAFAFHEKIGRRAVVERTVSQASRLKDGLAALDGIEVVTPIDPDVSAGMVCVDVGSMAPANAVQDLRARGIVASVTPYATPYLRFGPSIVTSPEEVDAVVAAVAELS